MKTALRVTVNSTAPPFDVVVIDTETTGFGASARLVEVAAIHARNGEPLREFHTLVDPGVRIPAAATAVHGITNAMVRGAPAASEALDALFVFAAGLPWVAHNAAFDRNILAGELGRAARPSPDVAVYCTLRLARKAFPHAPNHRLATLAEHLDLDRAPTHRALADAHTALALLRACLRGEHDSLARRHGPPVRL